MRHAAAMVLLCLVAALSAACSSPTADAAAPMPARPQRIVSINPCADALLHALADPNQIRAISHYSRDPRATSVPLDWAANHPITGGTAEEIIAMRPDLVVAGPHVALPTLAALERMGIPVVKLAVPNSVGESRAQAEALGSAIGQPARGALLSRALGQALADARAKAAEPIPALIWQGGGLVPGPGTLADELLAATGHTNLAATIGLGAWDVLGLERLVAHAPAILYAGDRPGEGNRVASHPVVARLAGHSSMAPFPGRLLFCGGPTIIAALDHLSASRGAYAPR